MAKYTDHTINTSSTNGITTNIGTAMKIAGSDLTGLSYIMNQMQTDGSVRTFIGARNINTSGTSTDAQIGIINRKNGTHDYVVTQPINFLSAINIKFNGTLGGNVLTVFKALSSNSLNFWYNSNQPTGRPSGCDWGAYFMYRGEDRGFIIYIDSSHLATSYNNNATTSISWHIV